MTKYATRPAPVDIFVGPIHQSSCGNVTAYPVANRAHYAAFQVSRPITVSKVRFYVAVQSGNMSIAICDAAFGRLATTGTFTVPAIGEQTQALTGSLTLVPGTRYYAAISADNTTVAFLGNTSGAVMGGSAVPVAIVALATAHPVPLSGSPSIAVARTFYTNFEV